MGLLITVTSSLGLGLLEIITSPFGRWKLSFGLAPRSLLVAPSCLVLGCLRAGEEEGTGSQLTATSELGVLELELEAADSREVEESLGSLGIEGVDSEPRSELELEEDSAVPRPELEEFGEDLGPLSKASFPSFFKVSHISPSSSFSSLGVASMSMT